MTHPRHICFNCNNPVEPDEPEVLVDPERIRQVRERKSKAGLRRNSDDNPRRYQHATMEGCIEADRKAARW